MPFSGSLWRVRSYSSFPFFFPVQEWNLEVGIQRRETRCECKTVAAPTLPMPLIVSVGAEKQVILTRHVGTDTVKVIQPFYTVHREWAKERDRKTEGEFFFVLTMNCIVLSTDIHMYWKRRNDKKWVSGRKWGKNLGKLMEKKIAERGQDNEWTVFSSLFFPSSIFTLYQSKV